MAIILAYKIEQEPSQTPKPNSPISPRNYTNIHTHWSHTITPHTPPKPSGMAPLQLQPQPPPQPQQPLIPTPEPTIETTNPVTIPQPPGWKMLIQPPDPEDAMDAETIWNTQFNSRRTAPRPTTAPTSSIKSIIPTSWPQKIHSRRRKRVSFARQLETIIPPSCTDLVLYGAHCSPRAPRRSRWTRYWGSRTGRLVQGGLWITGFIVVELMLLAFILERRKRGAGGVVTGGHDDNF